MFSLDGENASDASLGYTTTPKRRWPLRRGRFYCSTCVLYRFTAFFLLTSFISDTKPLQTFPNVASLYICRIAAASTQSYKLCNMTCFPRQQQQQQQHRQCLRHQQFDDRRFRRNNERSSLGVLWRRFAPAVNLVISRERSWLLAANAELSDRQRERERERERDSALAAIAVSKRQLQSAAEASPRQPGLLLLIFARQRAVSKPAGSTVDRRARYVKRRLKHAVCVYIAAVSAPADILYNG